METVRATVVGSDGGRYTRDQYLGWVDDAENRLLRNLFATVDLISSLHSERYWRIHNLDESSTRLAALLIAEIDLQLGLPLNTSDRLSDYRRLRERTGDVFVLDTNTFMHCTLFTDINCLAEFDAAAVRFILPLLVLGELDDKTHARLSKRASKVLRTLDPFMDQATGAGAAEIATGLTLEVLRDDEDHHRQSYSTEQNSSCRSSNARSHPSPPTTACAYGARPVVFTSA